MATKIDLEKLVHEIGPGFAEKSAPHDQNDTFVGENYNVLKEHRVFSAIVPLELKGGGATYTEMRRRRRVAPAALTPEMSRPT